MSEPESQSEPRRHDRPSAPIDADPAALLEHADRLAAEAAIELGMGPPPADPSSNVKLNSVAHPGDDVADIEARLEKLTRLITEANRQAAEWAANPDRARSQQPAAKAPVDEKPPTRAVGRTEPPAGDSASARGEGRIRGDVPPDNDEPARTSESAASAAADRTDFESASGVAPPDIDPSALAAPAPPAVESRPIESPTLESPELALPEFAPPELAPPEPVLPPHSPTQLAPTDAALPPVDPAPVDSPTPDAALDPYADPVAEAQNAPQASDPAAAGEFASDKPAAAEASTDAAALDDAIDSEIAPGESAADDLVASEIAPGDAVTDEIIADAVAADAVAAKAVVAPNADTTDEAAANELLAEVVPAPGSDAVDSLASTAAAPDSAAQAVSAGEFALSATVAVPGVVEPLATDDVSPSNTVVAPDLASSDPESMTSAPDGPDAESEQIGRSADGLTPSSGALENPPVSAPKPVDAPRAESVAAADPVIQALLAQAAAISGTEPTEEQPADFASVVDDAMQADPAVNAADFAETMSAAAAGDDESASINDMFVNLPEVAAAGPDAPPADLSEADAAMAAVPADPDPAARNATTIADADAAGTTEPFPAPEADALRSAADWSEPGDEAPPPSLDSLVAAAAEAAELEELRSGPATSGVAEKVESATEVEQSAADAQPAAGPTATAMDESADEAEPAESPDAPATEAAADQGQGATNSAEPTEAGVVDQPPDQPAAGGGSAGPATADLGGAAPGAAEPGAAESVVNAESTGPAGPAVATDATAAPAKRSRLAVVARAAVVPARLALDVVNRPFADVGTTTRNLAGAIGVITLCSAAVLWLTPAPTPSATDAARHAVQDTQAAAPLSDRDSTVPGPVGDGPNSASQVPPDVEQQSPAPLPAATSAMEIESPAASAQDPNQPRTAEPDATPTANSANEPDQPSSMPNG